MGIQFFFIPLHYSFFTLKNMDIRHLRCPKLVIGCPKDTWALLHKTMVTLQLMISLQTMVTLIDFLTLIGYAAVLLW